MYLESLTVTQITLYSRDVVSVLRPIFLTSQSRLSLEIEGMSRSRSCSKSQTPWSRVGLVP